MAGFKQTRLGQTLGRLAAIGGMPVHMLKGIQEYRRDGHIALPTWHRLLKAHCASNGRTTELLNMATRLIRPPRDKRPVAGLLGSFSVAQQEEIVSKLRRDGFFIFPGLLSESFCDALQAFAQSANTVTEGNRDLKHPLQRYDPAHPVSRTYKIPEGDILGNAEMQKLIADPVFIAVAERYLNTLPAIGGLDMWWSPRYGNAPGSDAAQLFHFDFDAPPAWLKLFVYVTDVGPENGPHVYVRGSHKAGLPEASEFRARGYERIDDEEIIAAFGADALVEIAGKRGTVFMADTRGFHKGKFPTEWHRLVAQVIYCSPLFCDHGIPAKLPDKLTPTLADAMNKDPRVYDRWREGLQ